MGLKDLLNVVVGTVEIVTSLINPASYVDKEQQYANWEQAQRTERQAQVSRETGRKSENIPAEHRPPPKK